MKTLVIDKLAVKKNIAVLKRRAEKAAIYAVLTGDAHGAGLVEMALLLRDEGIVRYAVSEPEDAAALRRAGLTEEEILMLRSTTDREELEQLLDLNVVCTVGSAETAMALNGVAEARSAVVETHIQVDTGMGFGGFLTDEVDKILSVYRNLPNVAVSGIYTQIHTAGVKEKDVAEQLDEFSQTVEAVRAAGFETGVVHAAGSYALMRYDFTRMDAVRVGTALLGRCSRVKNDGLQRVGWGEATIDDIHWLPKGHTVGNETLTRLRRPTRVAVLPVGYQNGFGVERVRESGFWATWRRWRRAGRRTVRIGGQKVKVIGRIGAIETVLDVTDVRCAAGDLALFEIDPLFAKGLKREYR
jgi:alanine racemase